MQVFHGPFDVRRPLKTRWRYRNFLFTAARCSKLTLLTCPLSSRLLRIIHQRKASTVSSRQEHFPDLHHDNTTTNYLQFHRRRYINDEDDLYCTEISPGLESHKSRNAIPLCWFESFPAHCIFRSRLSSVRPTACCPLPTRPLPNHALPSSATTSINPNSALTQAQTITQTLLAPVFLLR